MLRVINLTHNLIQIDKKSKGKIEEIKKMGVIVNL